MPKVYSSEEKEKIKTNLKEAANKSMMEKGVKATTVDRLVGTVGIPKGTFYLFYESKEMLLFDVIMDFHQKIDNYMLKEMKKYGNKLNADQLTEIVWNAMEICFHSCLKTILNQKEMERILRKLPDEVVQSHFEHDDNLVENMIFSMVKNKEIEATAVAGALRAVIFAGMYEREIGQENFEESMKLLIRGILVQIL